MQESRKSLILSCSCQNYENHEIQRIPRPNYENHENLNIPRKNYENHDLFLTFHYRIMKIMKLELFHARKLKIMKFS